MSLKNFGIGGNGHNIHIHIGERFSQESFNTRQAKLNLHSWPFMVSPVSQVIKSQMGWVSGLDDKVQEQARKWDAKMPGGKQFQSLTSAYLEPVFEELAM